jgi:ABC-type Na+ efflux pump permease subunit
MFPGPVFHLELRRIARRKRYYLLLTLYGLLLLWVVWSNQPQPPMPSPSARLSILYSEYAGKSLFQTYATWQLVMVVLLTPGLVAGVIAVERERKTLASLLASRLTSGEIVLGKLGARWLQIACFVALGLPVLVLVKHFGGVALKDMVLALATPLTTAFFLGAASILVSIHARRQRNAIIGAYLLDLVWYIGPILVAMILLSGSGSGVFETVFDWITATCPLSFGVDVRRGGIGFWEPPSLGHAVRMMVLQVAFGALMARVAVRRLRPVFCKGESQEEHARAPERDRATPETAVSPTRPSTPEPQLAPPRPRPQCGEDAMLWKEVWATQPHGVTGVLGGLALAMMLILAAAFCVPKGLMSAQELLEHGYSAEYEDLYHRLDLNVRLRYLVTLTAGVLLLGVSSIAACSLAGERDKDTWISLVATPLTAFEILRGKAIGAFWSMRALLLVWLALVMMGLVVGAVHPLGVLGVTLATATYLAFGCVLGMVYSLRALTSSRAVVSTLITLIVLNGAYLLVFVPLQLRSVLPFLGVTPMVEELTLLSYLDAKWLLDFQSPDERMLELGLTCVLSVVLYASATFGLALWTLKSFDRVIDRPRVKSGKSSSVPLNRPPVQPRTFFRRG